MSKATKPLLQSEIEFLSRKRHQRERKAQEDPDSLLDSERKSDQVRTEPDLQSFSAPFDKREAEEQMREKQANEKGAIPRSIG